VHTVDKLKPGFWYSTHTALTPLAESNCSLFCSKHTPDSTNKDCILTELIFGQLYSTFEVPIWAPRDVAVTAGMKRLIPEGSKHIYSDREMAVNVLVG
jgi:hypothetical protein